MRHLLITALSLLVSIGAHAQVPDTLHWSMFRPLRVADFKMEPQTYTGMAGESFCMLSVNYERPNAFAKPRFITTAQFDRTKSWLDPQANTTDLLAYFQVMFDLYELHARRLKKDLQENAPSSDLGAFMNERYNAAMAALTNEFNDYRKEARMGQDPAAVKRWSERVRNDIAALAAFGGR